MRIAAACALVWATVISAAMPLASAQDSAQISYPSREYYLGLQLYREGAMVGAGEAFELALRRGRRDASGRWIDSIPAYAMLGDVHYQLGNLAGARDNFDAALTLMLQHEASLSTLDWPLRLLPAGGVPAVPIQWAPGVRRIQPAALPTRINIGIGELNPERVLRSGGAFQPARVLSVDGVEVLRAIAVVAYRRGEILGPLAVDDPLTEAAAGMAERMAARSNAVAGPMWMTVHGLLLAADDQSQKAAGLLQSGMAIGGLEHPLSPMAGVGLARLMRDDAQIDALRGAAIEASASAAMLEQPEWVGEALRVASASLANGADPALLAASTMVAETYVRRSRYAAVTANMVAADCAATAGNRPLATNLLGNIATLLRDRSARMPRQEATAAWIRARVLASGGQAAESLVAANQALAFAHGNGGPMIGTPTLLQRTIVAAALASGATAGEKAEEHLDALLRAPSAAAWARDPVDALSAAASDQSAARAGQLARAVERGDAAASLAATDRLLRSQLRAVLPVGGRPLDVRWLVAGPMEALAGDAEELRKTLPGPLASINQAHLRATAVRERLAEIPLVGDDAVVVKERNELWKELVELADAMEAATLSAALDRVPIPHVFPPEWQISGSSPIPDGAAIVTFVPVANSVIGIAVRGDGTTMWPVGNAASFKGRIARLLSEIGVGRRRAGRAQLPTDDSWRAEASRMREVLLPNDHIDLAQVRRLVIVPSGPLWYLPFELLPESGEQSPLVGDRIAVSYSPTPGLAIAPPAPTSVGDAVGYVSNQFFAPKDREDEADWVEKVRDRRENSVSLTESGLAVPGRFISARLQSVWIAAADQGPAAGAAALLYSPLMYDAKSGRGALADWMRFPWGAPQTVLLPGFRSKIGGDGSELFYTAFALQAAGTPQALLARWPVGGASTATVLGEMLQELPMESALAAWRRAVQVLRRSELNPMAEPLLSEGDRDREDLTGDHPLFWSGYMILQGLP